MRALERLPLVSAVSAASVPRTVFLVYLLVLCATHDGVLTGARVWCAIFAVAALLVPALQARYQFWLVIVFTLALNLLSNYDSAANHYWLTCYTTLYLALDAYREERHLEPSINVPRAPCDILGARLTQRAALAPEFSLTCNRID